jgi:hypothetical protein
VDLSTESVESASLTLQGVDDVHGGDGLALGVKNLAIALGTTLSESFVSFSESRHDNRNFSVR